MELVVLLKYSLWSDWPLKLGKTSVKESLTSVVNITGLSGWGCAHLVEYVTTSSTAYLEVKLDGGWDELTESVGGERSNDLLLWLFFRCRWSEGGAGGLTLI